MVFLFSAKNETFALAAESKTPEVEKVEAQPVTGNSYDATEKESSFVSNSELNYKPTF